MMRIKSELGIAGGLAVANPIPGDDDIPAARIGGIIDQAPADMEAHGIHGKEATPFLLGRIVQMTGGKPYGEHCPGENNARLNAHIERLIATNRRRAP